MRFQIFAALLTLSLIAAGISNTANAKTSLSTSAMTHADDRSIQSAAATQEEINQGPTEEDQKKFDDAMSNGQLSIHLGLLKRSGTMDKIKSYPRHTIFFITNSAFEKLPEKDMVALLDLENTNPEKLKYFLETYALKSVLRKYQLTTTRTRYQTISGGRIILQKTDDNVLLINDHPAVITDIPTNRGVIHITDHIRIPENWSLYGDTKEKDSTIIPLH